MALFNFSRLIAKYSRSFTVLVKSEGYYDDKGDYVDGSLTEIKLSGAIIGYAESKIQRSEGTLSAMDKALHTLTPLDNTLLGCTVVFKGSEYRIESQKGESNSDFTNVYSYTLKYVSAFNEGGGKND